ncbi:hypothetical protein RMATCC62417_07108 [Rhizopus microsporus]|nr:hypothetical protein RMATCC62417_07108 [Rhizopus microsporus]
MHAISKSAEDDILSLLSANLSSRKISKQTSVSRTFIDRLRNERLPGLKVSKGGRPAALSNADKRLCVRKVMVEGVESAVTIAKQLKGELGTNVSPEAVRMALVEAGIGAVEKFAKRYQNWAVEDWRRVIWSDETKINRFNSDGGAWAWVRDGSSLQPKQVKQTVKHGGGSVMVWSVISAAGPGWLCKIDTTMDKELYLSIIQDELARTIDDTAVESGLKVNQLYFQYDNDSKHTAKVVKEHLSQQEYRILEWPANSPDLNLIEHMWSLLKRRLNEYDTAPKGMNELFERITDTWYKKITKEDCLKVIDGMQVE